MFLRSPKHFKRGKQLITFFQNLYKHQLILNTKYNVNFLFSYNTMQILNLLKTTQIYTCKPGINLNKCLIKASINVKFND